MNVAPPLRHLPRLSPVVLLLWCVLSSVHAQTFVHPGGLHTQADLDRMKTHVAAGDHPWIDGWNKLIADSEAQNTYGAAPQANMGVSRQRASADAHAAYLNAIRWYVSGDTTYADCAVRICNGWSAAVNQVPTGTDMPGLIGIPIAEFAYAAEVLRIYPGWAAADFARFQTMMTTYLYPVCHDFLVNHNGTCVSHYWANWDACNVGAILGIGVLCDDQAKFTEAVDYYKNGAGNGCIMNAVFFVHPNGLGQWQESGRDQEHAQLGVGLLSSLCEVAWHQGIDLYSYGGNRLLAGAEYVARSNLSRPVPYSTYNNCDNVNQYYLSINGLGRIDDRPIWELVYNHYVVRMGLSAPNVKAMAELTRPERGSADHFGYGTLTFTLDAASSPYPSAPVSPAVMDLTATASVSRVILHWTPPAGDTAQGYIVRRATTAGGPYTAVTSWSANTYPEYWDESVTNGTTYYYVVAPVNQAGTGADSNEAQAKPAAAGTLPDGWVRQDVGNVSAPGGATFASVSNGTFIVTGNGSGIGGTADSLSYAYATVTGDCTITARLLVNGSTKVGLMMRDSTDANAAAASITLGDTGGRETRFGLRSSTGGTMSFVLGNDYTWTPVWYRLQRSGSTFTASQSLDGTTWFVVGSGSAAMSSIYLVGLAGCGSTATFDNVTVSGTFMPGPPQNLVATNGNGQESLTWSTAGGATSYNVKRSLTAGGPYQAIASGVTGTSYVDTGLTNGTSYYYVVSSALGTFESVNSAEATGTAGDITYTWSSTPASGSWSVGGNWNGGTSPTTGISLSFGASTVTALNNDIANLVVGRLSYLAGAPAFTLSGNAISLGGDILNSSGATQTITLPVVLTNNRVINASAGAVTVSGVVSDGGIGFGLTKTGSQPLSLTALNSFSGDVVHTTGTLSIAGTGTGIGGAPTAGALGRGTVRLGGGVLTSSAAALVYNNIVLQSGTTSSVASTSANITLAGNLSGSGNITESGTNVGGTHFNGDNSGFTGTFTSSNATNHRVRFNSATAGSAGATWILNNSQTDGYGLTFGNGTISFGALSGGGQFRSDSASGTTGIISIGALNTNTTFGGIMVANGTRYIGVTKVGSGTLTFTGKHTYNGPTTVTSGTLLVNSPGSLASAVSVGGGTFGGTGSSSAGVTVGSGATLAPGNGGVGTFATTGALTLNTGATYAAEINSTAGTADKVVAASVNLNGATLALTDLGGAALAAGTQFTLIDNSGTAAVSGTFVGLPEGTLFTVGANQYRISYAGGTGNDVVVTVIVAATLVLDGLNQTYDGTPKSISVATTPPNLPVIVTYNGSTTPPTGAGAYAVSAVVADPNYLGSVSGTFVIAQAPAAIALGNLVQTYDGSPKSASVSTTPVGLAVELTYGGAPTPPTSAGNYAVVATINDANYTGSTSAAFIINQAQASVALGNLSAIYDGSPKPVSVITAPGGLPVVVTYDGSTTAPTNAGSYAVVATVNDPNYQGGATGTLVVAKAGATVTLGNLSQRYDGTAKTVSVTTTPANLHVDLTYDGNASAPAYPGDHPVVATINERNYAGSASDTLVVTITALVRQAPSLNGDLDGSLQMLAAQSVSVNGNAAVSGDVLVPGAPMTQINGQPTYVGVIDGPGAASPSNYMVTLNNGAVLRYLVRRIDPRLMASVDAPPLPGGTRDVTINNANQTIGDASTLRNLTLNSNAGTVAVPPGTYGGFSVNGSSVLVLGVAGATFPSIYNLQSLAVNSNAQVQLAGPVILTLAYGPSINGQLATTTVPNWLTLRIASGGLTINSGAQVNGIVFSPNGLNSINGRLNGRTISDQLTINNNGLLTEP